MAKILFLIILMLLNGTGCTLFKKFMHSRQRVNYKTKLNTNDDYETEEEPLILTKYIIAGEFLKARQASRVDNLTGVNIESYSGFFTVNPSYDSNMFFWYFPPKSGSTNTSLLVWLQGGPGASSMFGLFVENGPLRVVDQDKLIMWDYSWNQEFGVVYIDNPVGTGFSFTKDDKGFAKNEADVGRNLYEAMRQFFLIFPEYRNQPLFLTGESYAGKYIPAFGMKIHKMGRKARYHGFNLQGMAIGNGWFDPVNMLDNANNLYQLGLLDEQQRDRFLAVQQQAQRKIEQKQFGAALDLMDSLYFSDLFHGKTTFENYTGYTFYYNLLEESDEPQNSQYIHLLETKSIRKAIHVSNVPFLDSSEQVELFLYNDVMASITLWIRALLNANYRMLFYTGNLDICIPFSLNDAALMKLEWRHSNEFRRTRRLKFRTSKESDHISGYIRQVANLQQVLIRNAGHMVPLDQPEVALDMITRFVKNEKFIINDDNVY